jgi:uncharacterized protein
MDRPKHLASVRLLLRRSRVVALLGARQVGKTTLARAIHGAAAGPKLYLDLEDPRDLDLLADPMLLLSDRRGLVVLDEIQRRPELFPVLRVLADRPRGARFLVLGSASPELLRQSSETLAGRIAFHELPPFGLDEVGNERHRRLWTRGGFARSFLAATEAESARWRRDFVRTLLAREVTDFGIGIPTAQLERFWAMLAHWHGQVWNASEFARSFGVSHQTVRRYLDLLAGLFVARVLPPWFENLAKRQVKAPKVYIADSGILHTLLGVGSQEDLLRNPKVGASWEGFCVETVLEILSAARGEAFFWATHGGAELDLLVVRGRQRRGFEMKLSSSVTLTPSMRLAMNDLELDSLEVIYSGDRVYQLGPRIRAVPLARLTEELAPLRA